MKETDVLIAHNKGVYNIKVEGRATFEYGPPLRTLAKNLENELFERISVDLNECAGMDSTFMGLLAMLGLRARKINAVMEILNANEMNMGLLRGLGLEKLFKFSVKNIAEDKDTDWKKAETQSDKLSTAEAVVDAHDTLMDIDPGNIPKFERVVDFAKKDLDKLKK
ncbi:MAG: hypothetical protein A2017_18715 [Lentisphaerae bacterium GWF2_44_16]|nr:MAG: hypothetical protein A2017_18715 [Lentisphaerae bacterium GWF2_44_16]